MKILIKSEWPSHYLRAMADGTSLNKYIAASGVCSRRQADVMIEAGRIKLNGEIARKGNRVRKNDTVLIDDQPIGRKPNAVWLAYHKPVGITCTTDKRDPTNIVDAVGYPGRVFPVGRLDKNSEGLIWLTNDGDEVNKILRAANEHEKEYIVTVDKPVSLTFLRRISEGVYLPGLKVTTKPAFVEQVAPKTFRIVIVQGLNRQIRRMCETLDYRVRKLRRVRIMHMPLGKLEYGVARDFTTAEVQNLKHMLKDSYGGPAAKSATKKS